jgi:Ca-activated chloride channel family protein
MTGGLLVLTSRLEAQSTGGGERGRAVIVLDASGSMWGAVEGRAKIEVAREVMQKLVAKLPENLDLGLMAYGHRHEGDCNDIELLIPPGTVDRRVFLRKALSIVPKGKTPLTAAVEMAAQALSFTENPATVILVSDGLENCGGDPCALAAKLKQQGVAFRAHVVAFDLAAKDAETFRCLADITGGRFLPAQDAASLGDALQIAVKEAATPPPPASTASTPAPPLPVEPAELTAPETVVMGSTFEVKWKGPDNPGDFITIITPAAKEKEYGNYAYTRRGNPLEIVAPIEPGDYELRYMVSHANKVTGRRAIKVVPAPFEIKPPAQVVAGAFAEIEWSGLHGRGDLITIVPPGAKEGEYGHYAYAMHGSPAKVRAPGDAGDYEVRYRSGQGGKTLAKAPLKVTPAEATLLAPEEAMAGSMVKVTWTGPGATGDWITAVPPDASPRAYDRYAYARKGSSPVSLEMPAKPGSYEIRYVASAVDRIVTRVPIKVTEAKATVATSEEVVAGTEIEVDWTGPAGGADYVVIVPANHTAKGNYLKSWRADKGTPAKLLTPETAGAFEVRYVNRGGEALARQAVKLTEAKAGFDAPKTIRVSQALIIKWTGPNNPGDHVTIQPKGSPDRNIGGGISAQSGSPQTIRTPSKAGEYELRYVTGQLRSILAREPITVTEE